MQRPWIHSLRPTACTARRHLVHFPPDDLGSPCPWDVDTAPYAMYSAKNVRMRGVVVCAVMSFVFLCSCSLRTPWRRCEDWLGTPSRRSRVCSRVSTLSTVACALDEASACRRCRIHPCSFWRDSRTLVVISSTSVIASPSCVSYAAAEASRSAWRSASSRHVIGTVVMARRGRAPSAGAQARGARAGPPTATARGG